MDAENQQKKQHKSPWLKEYEWKPGQSGNPAGRPVGKTLKVWAREFLEDLPDDKKLEFLREMEPDIVWRMAEGNPHQTQDTEVKGKVIVEISKESAEKNDATTPKPEDSM